MARTDHENPRLVAAYRRDAAVSVRAAVAVVAARLTAAAAPEVSGGDLRGEALGCPDCASGEPHVCPFLMADLMPEPRRSAVLTHMRDALDVDAPECSCDMTEGGQRRCPAHGEDAYLAASLADQVDAVPERLLREQGGERP